MKIGAALAVAALGTYGGYRLAKSGKLEPFVAAGKQKAAELMEEAGKSGVQLLKLMHIQTIRERMRKRVFEC